MVVSDQLPANDTLAPGFFKCTAASYGGDDALDLWVRQSACVDNEAGK